MNKPAVVGVLGAAALAAAVFWSTQRYATEVAPASPERVAITKRDELSAATAAATAEESVDRQAASNSPPAAAPMMSAVDVDEYSEDPTKMFKADKAGNLILKERTRINVEKLSWLYTPEELQQKLAAIEQTLPPSAYRQLTDLMDRFKNYSLGAKQAYPPENSPATMEEVIAQHEGLQSLRRAHFGGDAAEAMFGREERLSRKLLDFMSLEQHKGLTLEEKAMKAQEMLQQSPELAALYDENRVVANQD